MENKIKELSREGQSALVDVMKSPSLAFHSLHTYSSAGSLSNMNTMNLGTILSLDK